MADKGCFLHGGHKVKNVLPEDAVVVVGVDGEVADTERSEVLEEVCALAWVNAIVLQSCLYDETCAADVWPLYGYAEPVVA